MSSNLNKLYIKVCYISLLNLFAIVCFSQVDVELYNPSFEDTPSDATVPQQWFACADATTPDILPGYWGVYQEAEHGETFVGMITRENGTYESIGQRLKSSLQEANCYTMSLYLAKSENYTGYNQSLKLKIWISDTKCEKEQLIFESDYIESEDWEKQIFEFVPKKNAKYIKLEAFAKEGYFSHKGNILIDHLSTIVKCKRV